MENIHGVDVSWLHHTNKDRAARKEQPNHPAQPPGPPTDPAPPKSHNHFLHKRGFSKDGNGGPIATATVTAVTANGSPAARQPVGTPQPPSAATSQTNGNSNATPKRPGLLSRSSSTGKSGRKGSWISSLSSKLSSSSSQAQTQPPPQAQAGAQSAQSALSSAQSTPSKEKSGDKGYFEDNTSRATSGASTPIEEAEPYTPPQQKTASSGFFSNALRRLSSGSQVGTPKPSMSKDAAPRRTLNIDPNRPRCLVPELDANKLRRVAFCVDVEIAGGPKYKEEKGDAERKKKFKEKKALEKKEGEALKHPEKVAEEKDTNALVPEPPATPEPEAIPADPRTSTGSVASVDGEKKDGSRKKEKKKQYEEERKQRKEEKRRKAEANGDIPMELKRDSSSESAAPSPTAEKPVEEAVPAKPPANRAHTDRPTIDPLRMYRRCCQLRETPILKRITEQLGDPKRCPAATPGVVSLLDLTGSRLQLQDLVTLGDWLAIVPVQKLILEDSDLSDEGLRVVLAGLLAAMQPDQPRHRRHRLSNGDVNKYEERSGIVEKLSLKNNSRITKEGWKHISVFVYMCSSLKALDLSMLSFPRSPVPSVDSVPVTPATGGAPTTPAIQDPAEIFSKALAERLAGGKLEELIMGECNLSGHAIRLIVDAASISGIKRVGFASNHLDDEGLEAIARYMRSGLCHGLDLGGNDMTKARIETIAAAMHKDATLWALSLADCGLTPDAIGPLFPGILSLPNLRFLDLSHNNALFESQPSVIISLRRYLPMLPILKRFHLTDVNLSPAQAIALAEILPECHQLAHLNISGNPQISALASATTEEAQEEACALYASLMVATRCSHTLLAIDVDVPSADNSEVVKALAKQIIAYCLRNMQTVAELDNPDKIDAVQRAKAENPTPKKVDLPELLIHLVGHTDEGQEDPNPEDRAPDNDYIVGGTGVVKALNYMLKEKAAEIHREVASGGETRENDDESGNQADIAHEQKLAVAPHETAVGAKTMSKNLLDSARKIRQTLYPAMVKEMKAGDDMAYRRLLFLDNTLQQTILRFESEYPDLVVPTDPSNNPKVRAGIKHDPGSFYTDQMRREASNGAAGDFAPVNHDTPETPPNESEEDDGSNQGSNVAIRPKMRSRHNSDVSLASRALSTEEGQMHRLGQHVKRKINAVSASVPGSPSRPSSSRGLSIPSPGISTPTQTDPNNTTSYLHVPAGDGSIAGDSATEDPFLTADEGDTRDHAHRPSARFDFADDEEPPEELKRIFDKLNNLESEELRRAVAEKGVDEALRQLSGKVEELGLMDDDVKGVSSAK